MGQKSIGIITNLTAVIFVSKHCYIPICYYIYIQKALISEKPTWSGIHGHNYLFGHWVPGLSQLSQRCVGPVHVHLATWRFGPSKVRRIPRSSSSFPSECDSETDDTSDRQGRSATYDRHADKTLCNVQETRM